MKESLITKLPTNELMNPSQKKKRKHRQVLDKLVLFLKRNQIHYFLCQRIPGNPHLAPICAHVPLSRRADGADGWRWPWPLGSPRPCRPGGGLGGPEGRAARCLAAVGTAVPLS